MQIAELEQRTVGDRIEHQDSTTKPPSKQLRIAMIGQKGLPATYGGIEHHVENLAAGLASRGHKVTVFCRPYYSSNLDSRADVERTGPRSYLYRGCRLAMVPSLQTKHLDAISHATLSTAIAGANGFDIIHIHGIGPSLVSFLPGLVNKPVVSTIHALDYRQEKWGRFAKMCLKSGLKCALTFPRRSICVSRVIENAVGRSSRTTVIPNGVKDPDRWGDAESSWMRSRGLTPGQYILFVGRLIQDKGCHLLSRAVREIGNGLKLAVAGDSSFTDSYVQRLKGQAGSETVFLGGVYEKRLSALYSNCALFVLPSSVEGLPIALIEAMKHRAPVLASDISENLEIINGDNGDGPVGLTFKNGDRDSLRDAVSFALSDPELLQHQADRAFTMVSDRYNWMKIVRKTEQVYYQALR